MKTPLGFFDSNASGLLRNRLDGAAAETETLLAHNLADIVGTIAMFVSMLVLMLVMRLTAICRCMVLMLRYLPSRFTPTVASFIVTQTTTRRVVVVKSISRNSRKLMPSIISVSDSPNKMP